MPINRFNIRVYFLLFEGEKVLLSDELIRENAYTKFPGGGLEFGEGTRECARREAAEELGIEVEVLSHLYTTDFFQQSFFVETDQILSIYYVVRNCSDKQIQTSHIRFDFAGSHNQESFRWVDRRLLKEEDLSFPIDKKVLTLVKEWKKSDDTEC